MSLRRPTFHTRRLTEAYDMGEVDDAIDRIFAALAADPPTMTAQEVAGLRFTPTRLRDGYDISEVDQWLDEAAAELAARGGSAPAAPATSGSALAPTAGAPTTSDAIVEVRSGRTRLVVVLLVVALLVATVWAYVG